VQEAAFFISALAGNGRDCSSLTDGLSASERCWMLYSLACQRGDALIARPDHRCRPPPAHSTAGARPL